MTLRQQGVEQSSQTGERPMGYAFIIGRAGWWDEILWCFDFWRSLYRQFHDFYGLFPRNHRVMGGCHIALLRYLKWGY
jgi:hypothetical protein